MSSLTSRFFFNSTWFQNRAVDKVAQESYYKNFVLPPNTNYIRIAILMTSLYAKKNVHWQVVTRK